MPPITLQDLRFRARQFTIAIIGAGVIFAMTLLLAGFTAGFSVEIHDTVQGIGAQSWVLAKGSVPRVASLSPMPASAVSAIARSQGVTQAEPLIVVPQAANLPGRPVHSVNLIGYQPGQSMGGPGEQVNGSPLTASGEAVVDSSLGRQVGQRFAVSGQGFRVVGVVGNRTLLGGVPNIYVTLRDAQDIIFGGAPFICAVLVSGSPRTLPAGYQLFSNAQIEKASLAQLASAVSSISNSRAFM